MANIEKMIDEIGEMTVLELSELVKALEDKFGVSASAMPAMAVAGAVPAVGQLLKGKQKKRLRRPSLMSNSKRSADRKSLLLKRYASITGLGLKEAKEKVESAPVVIQEGVSKEDAEKTKEQLEAIGAVVEIL